MIAYTALAVHRRVWKEHKIDKTVFHIMRREQFIGILGIILMANLGIKPYTLNPSRISSGGVF